MLRMRLGKAWMKTGESSRLPRALAQMKDAATSWERIVQLTDGVYHGNLVFGYGPRDEPVQPPT